MKFNGEVVEYFQLFGILWYNGVTA